MDLRPTQARHCPDIGPVLVIGSAARVRRSLKPPWHVPFDQEVCTSMSVDNTTTTAAASVDASNTEIEIAASETETAQIDAAQTETAATESAAPEAAQPLDTGTEVTFASLDLPKPLLEVLKEAGVATAFPIQAATIPDALVGRDVMGRGRTGS